MAGNHRKTRPQIRLWAGLIFLLGAQAAVPADVIVYHEDFGDRLTYPDGSPALQKGDVTGQHPYCYDTRAYPPRGKVFYEIWDATQGKGEIVDTGGPHGQVLQVWGKGKSGEWGRAVHNTFMKMFRPAYELPLVVEFKFRPFPYNPRPAVPGPYPGIAGDPMFDYKELACKWRFYVDDPKGAGAGYRIKYSLYYDGTLWQAFRQQGFPGKGENPGPAVDIGGKDARPEDIWNARSGKWLEYRLFHDVSNQEIKIYLTSDDNPLHHPFIDKDGKDLDKEKIIRVFTISPGKNGMKKDEKLGYVRFRQFGELQGGADQTPRFSEGHYRGDDDEDGSRAEYDDIFIYYPGAPERIRRISGKFTIEYPYWCYYKFTGLEWQLREPAREGRPGKIIQSGIEDFHLWSASRATKRHEDYPKTEEPNIPLVREYALGMVAPGTYDLAFKHGNHLAAVITNLVVPADADVSGVDFTLFAGDASGDFINRLESGIPVIEPDNDCDSWDLATVRAELGKSPLGLSGPEYRGQSGDFDGDGCVTTWDLAVVDTASGSYPSKPRPGNWIGK